MRPVDLYGHLHIYTHLMGSVTHLKSSWFDRYHSSHAQEFRHTVPIVSVNVQVLTRCLFHTNWIAVISVYVFIFVLSNSTSIHRSFSSSPSPEPSVLLSTPSSLQSILCLSDGRSDHHSGGAFGWRLLQLSGSEHRRQCDHQSPAGGYRRWDRWSRSERKSLGEVTPKKFILYLHILDW